jgi:hypothetical protein
MLLRGELGEDVPERQRAPVRGRSARRARLVALHVARRVRLLIVHHVHGDALETDARAAAGQAEMHDRGQIGGVELGRDDVARGLVLHREHEAPHHERPDRAAVHRLRQPL